MFFVISKIFWLLMQPFSVLVILIVASLLATWARRRRLAGGLLSAAVALVALTSFTTFGAVLLSPLEERFPKPPAPPAHIDGIIVLGGFFDGHVDQARGGYELNDAGDRIVEGLRLAMRNPQARVVVAGGIGELVGKSEGDGTAAPRFFGAFGLGGSRFEYETRSRNTWQNAVYSRELVKPKPGETWLLVTSAAHMPRAVGCFREAGFPVVPWPVDYQTVPDVWLKPTVDDPIGYLWLTTLAFKEWIGLAVYRMTGRTSAFFPGPVGDRDGK